MVDNLFDGTLNLTYLAMKADLVGKAEQQRAAWALELKAALEPLLRKGVSVKSVNIAESYGDITSITLIHNAGRLGCPVTTVIEGYDGGDIGYLYIGPPKAD